MKKMVLCGLSVSAILLSGSAFAGSKTWEQYGVPFTGVKRGFERVEQLNKYESMQYGQSIQWERKAKEPLADVSKLYNANIIEDHYKDNFYIWGKRHIGVVEVGTNFYRLSSKDMHTVLRSFDTAYNYTRDGKGYIQIRDARTREEVGTYGPEGLFLQ